MNIGEVSQQLASLLSKAGSLYFSAGDDLAKNLALGQIIKGKVLLSYQDGRYLVDFSGQQKVVDSSVPIKVGETIQGRVVGVGEKVEIKRLVGMDDDAANALESKMGPAGFLSNKWDRMLFDAMQKFHSDLNAQGRALVVNLMKKSDQPQLILLSALALQKQKIPLSPELIQRFADMYGCKRDFSMLPEKQSAPVLEFSRESVDSTRYADEVGVLASRLADMAKQQQSVATRLSQVKRDIPETDGGAADGNAGQESEHDKAFSLGWYLLNNQIDGALQHRVGTFPFWIGERLVEVNIAIYEQPSRTGMEQTLSFRKIVFSLEMEKLGLVEMELTMANRHLGLKVSADSHDASQALIASASELGEQLNDFGWQLDEISYSTRSRDDMGDVVGTVVDHYLSQDSLSRLM